MIIYFQSTYRFTNIGRVISRYQTYQDFGIKNINKLLAGRYIDLMAFSLMPNHFHLLIKQRTEQGISQYMQRLLNSYTKYFNTKYERSGHLFQGPFKAIHIQNRQQLLYLSAYIHRNAREIPQWKNQECLYPWSSFQDYAKQNRWPDLLKTNYLLKQFESPKDYQDFVDNSGAKIGSQDLEEILNIK